MGLAILNAETETANLTIRAFDTEGTETAVTILDLDPGQRLVDLLNGPKLFGEQFSQVGGHLEVTSSVPVFSVGLFGDFQLERLSAVEGQQGLR